MQLGLQPTILLSGFSFGVCWKYLDFAQLRLLFHHASSASSTPSVHTLCAGGRRAHGSLSAVSLKYASALLADSIKAVADALNAPELVANPEEAEAAIAAKRAELDAAKPTHEVRVIVSGMYSSTYSDALRGITYSFFSNEDHARVEYSAMFL